MNSAGAPLQLPGYTWDPETRRYFKQSTSAIRQTPASTARAAAAAALAQAERERAHNQETSHRQARAKQARQRKLERDDDDDGHDRLAAWRNSVLAPWLVQPAKRDKLKLSVKKPRLSNFQGRKKSADDFRAKNSRLQGSHLATKIGSVRTIYPDCLTMDDSIQHISFDETNPSTLRVGTSSGTIASVSPVSPLATSFCSQDDTCRTDRRPMIRGPRPAAFPANSSPKRTEPAT